MLTKRAQSSGVDPSHKLEMAMHTPHRSTLKAEAGGSEVQSRPQLRSEFNASLEGRE